MQSVKEHLLNWFDSTLDVFIDWNDNHWIFVHFVWPPIAFLGTLALCNLIATGDLY